MPLVEKKKLKDSFKSGATPSQEDFENLIDSMIHRQDSGFVSQESGLRLSPKGEKNQLITFFQNITDLKEKWSLEQKFSPEEDFGLSFLNKKREEILTILSNGNIGINNPKPQHTLDINGYFSSTGRIGSFAKGEAPADGNWYIIAPKLTGCKALEIVAKVGKQGKGMYSMIHAIAISTFGKSNSKIKITNAYYGSFANKIDLRWDGEIFNYNLQIRTRKNYDSEMIKYHITSLWQD